LYFSELFTHFYKIWNFMRISKNLLEKKKMKKGKPWNNTVLLSAQDLTLRGLAARGRLQAQRPHGPAARA
jgi:hypothetical protein